MAEESGSIYSEIRVRLDKLSGDLKKVDAKFDQFAKENKKTTDEIANNSEKNTKKITKNWKTAFSAISVGAAVALAAVGLAFKKAVTVFSKTEQSLANVQAASNATAADFKRLEDAALAAGDQTRFSASEAADALFFLASAGLTAAESVDALDSVLLLAGATGSDLATTASVLTATMSQFSIAAEDAADISNIFAAANSNSQATMEKLGGALRQVGPIAGTFNIGLEEVVGSLQELFNAGFRGEAAGVALRNAIGDLANPVSTVNKKLQALGVSFDQVDPGKVGFTGAIKALEEAGIDATKAIELFGKESGPQLATLLKAGSDQLEKLQADVTGTTEAARQYAVQNDTLAGSIDSFKSKAESTGIAIVSILAPALRKLFEFGGKAAQAITEWAKFIKLNRDIAETQADLADATERLNLTSLANEYYGLAAAETLSVTEKERLEELNETLLELLPGLTQEILNNKTATYDLVEADSALAKGKAIEALQVATKLREDLTAKIKEEQKAIEEGIEFSFRWDVLKQRGSKLNKELTEEESEALKKLQEGVRNATSEQTLYNALLEVSGSATNLLTDEMKAMLKTNVELSDQYVTARQALDDLDVEMGTNLTTFEKYESQFKKNQEAAKESTEEAIRLEEIRQAEAQAKLDAENDAAAALIAAGEAAEALAESERILAEATAESDAAEENRLRSLQDALDKETALAEQALLLAQIRRDQAIEKELAAIKDSEYRDEQSRLAKEHFEQIKAEQEAAKDLGETWDERLARLKEEEKARDILETKAKEIEAANQKRAEQEKQRALDEELAHRKQSEAVALEIAEEERLDAVKQQALDDELSARIEAEEKLKEISDKAADDEIDNAKKVATAKNDLLDLSIQKGIEVANILFEINNNKIQAELDAEREALNTKLGLLDEELQAALEAAGVAEATELEKLQTQLAAAIAKEDAVKQKELENSIERLKITKEFEDKKTAAEEESAKKSAQLQYEQALNAWNLQGLQIISSTATATIKAIAAVADAGPVAMIAAGVLTAGLGVAAGALHLDGKPEPPQFQTGGMVLGNGSAGTNAIVAEGGTDELLFNSGQPGERFIRQFADGIAQALGSRSVPIHTTIVLNDQTLYDAVSFGNENGHIKGVNES